MISIRKAMRCILISLMTQPYISHLTDGQAWVGLIFSFRMARAINGQNLNISDHLSTPEETISGLRLMKIKYPDFSHQTVPRARVTIFIHLLYLLKPTP